MLDPNVVSMLLADLIPLLKCAGCVIQRSSHSYLLVSDAVSKQRYTWQEARYPLSTIENNWHMREGLVVNGQNELNDFVSKQLNKKENFFSVWVSDYHSNKYSIIKITDRYKDISISSNLIPAIGNQTDEIKPVATAIVFRVKYIS